jgi:DNA-binding MarR family transcriptional regulator
VCVIVSVEFARLWMKMTKEWKTHLEEELAPGLTEGQLGVLELLLQLQPMKPSDLLAFLATTPAAITTLLDRMERGGLVVRNRDENDRRIVWVTVTEKGDAEARRGIAIREAYINGALDRISSHNQQLLVYLLGKVANS